MNEDFVFWGIILIFILLVIAIFDGLNSQPYRCSRCDFATWSKEEMIGHVALENTHKMIEP